MSGIYYGYLTESQREDFILESTIENEFNKLQMLYEMRSMQFEQNCRDAEIKVLTEGGTYDDLTYLINVAAFEAEGQKQGIIASMIAWIKKTWASIKAKIKNILGMGDPEEEVQVEAEEYNKIKKLSQACNELSTISSDVQAGRFKEASAKVGKVLKIGAIGTGVAVGGVAIVKASRGELQGFAKILEKIDELVLKPLDDMLKGFEAGFKGESAIVTETEEGKPVEGTASAATTPNNNQTTNNTTVNAGTDANQKADEKKGLVSKIRDVIAMVRNAIIKLEAWCTRNVQPENNQAQNQEPAKEGEQPKSEEQPKEGEQPKENTSKASENEAKKYGLEKNSLGVYHGKYKGYLYQIDARNEKVTVNIQAPKEVDPEGVLKFRRVDNINKMPHKEIINLVKMMQNENTIENKQKRADEIAAANKKELEEDMARRTQADIDKKNKKQAKKNSKMFNANASADSDDVVLDMSDVRELLGEGFTVECTEDTITIYTETAPNNIEEPEISREHSIFGSSVDFDTAMESAEERSEEFNRLAELIDSL